MTFPDYNIQDLLFDSPPHLWDTSGALGILSYLKGGIMSEGIKVLWVDEEHMDTVDVAFRFFKRDGIFVTPLESLNLEKVLSGCRGKDIVVIHCGTRRPMSGMREFLETIIDRYPRILIGLQTNVRHPSVYDLVDFYIQIPTLPFDLSDTLRWYYTNREYYLEENR